MDVKLNTWGIEFTSETQRKHPEIPPPRPRDLLKKKFVPAEPPKFIRDSLDVSDINGAQTKQPPYKM
jgi:hypothetical protein